MSTYTTLETIDDEGNENQFAYDDLVKDLRETCKAEFGLDWQDHDFWHGREGRVVSTNGTLAVGLSEYCGLVCRWLIALDDANPLEVAVTATRFQELFGDLIKVGTFSNGETIFQRR